MADEADALNSLKTIVSNGWNSANTDNLTPTFDIDGEQAMRESLIRNNAVINFHLTSHTTVPNGLGANHREATVDRVSITITTKNSRSHLRKCYNECRRIFASLINNPDSNFQQLMPIGMVDNTVPGYFEYIYDVYLKDWTVTR